MTDRKTERMDEQDRAIHAFLDTPLENVPENGFTAQTMRRVRIRKLLRRGLTLASLLVWLVPAILLFQVVAGLDFSSMMNWALPLPDMAGLGAEAGLLGIVFLLFAGLILIEP